MELKVDVGFEQLMQAIKQLPAAKIMQLKAELAKNKSATRTATESTDFQKFLLGGPVMDDKQYEGYKSLRNRVNKWRTK